MRMRGSGEPTDGLLRWRIKLFTISRVMLEWFNEVSFASDIIARDRKIDWRKRRDGNISQHNGFFFGSEERDERKDSKGC